MAEGFPAFINVSESMADKTHVDPRGRGAVYMSSDTSGFDVSFSTVIGEVT
jgi:hypothetical protein